MQRRLRCKFYLNRKRALNARLSAALFLTQVG
jgi:hypothetical protein